MRDLRDRNTSMLPDQVSVVIITHNRAPELLRTLEHMRALPERPAIVVVDNASTDATPALLTRHFPDLKLISLETNIGAAARNIGVQHVQTPYVAFCDDDSWWADGSLERATSIMDAYPKVAAVCARILLGPDEREDPICALMGSSPLPSMHLPGPAILGFVACAVVFRRQAYLDGGGYEPKFFVGGEEELLTLDLVTQGWSLVYARDLIVHHYPSPQRDIVDRQKIVIRNALWVAWLRLPLPSAVQETWRICRSAPRREVLKIALLNALRELPWVYRNRKVIPSAVWILYRKLRV
jgi:GT2 family glycosyltransferase